jgi:hypothetical protein
MVKTTITRPAKKACEPSTPQRSFCRREVLGKRSWDGIYVRYDGGTGGIHLQLNDFGAHGSDSG